MNRSDVEQLPLRAFRISNGALASAPNLPLRLKLLSWGRNESTKGPVIVGDKTASVLHVLQPQMGFGKVALDFEHNTVAGTDAYKESVEPRPVAAYGVPKVLPGDGLYLEEIEWTPRGKAEALNFADLSPAVKQDDGGEVVFIHSAALTRNGAVHELSFFNARTGANQNKQGMDPNETLSVGELGGALGIKSPTKQSVLAALTVLGALTALESRVKAVEDKAGTEIKTFSVTSAGKTQQVPIGDLAQIVIDLRDKFEANGLSALNAERQGVIVALSAEGKAPVNPETGDPYSAEELGKLELGTLKVLRANTPGTVPLSATARGRGSSGAVTPETFAAEVGKLMTGSGMDRDAATMAARKKLGC